MVASGEVLDPAQVRMSSLVAQNKSLHATIARGDSEVQKFYNDATVFITGGSGFLGKQLIEKLFRATKIAKIYLLLRPKKGKHIKERLQEMLDDPVYDILKSEQPGFEDRIEIVEGDVAELKLGMSEKDWTKIAEETDIIFHVAATTRFDEAIRVATLINVRGTREALTLARNCTKLRSFVHVSTAYSHAKDELIRNEVEEQFYPSPMDPNTMIRLAETVDDDRLNCITSGLIKGWPNTYSFGKAIAEELVRTMGAGLPICIVRPAIVICSKREPHPGWLDMSCIYGASGVVLGAGLGVMHAVFADREIILDLVPVDYVNNALIAAAWETAKRGQADIKIYAVSSANRNPTLFGDVIDGIDIEGREYVSPKIAWYGKAIPTGNLNLFILYSWIMHVIPGYLLDAICMVLGKNRRFVKLYNKMYIMSQALSYFTLNYWKFQDKNLQTLYKKLSPTDQEIFDFDITKIDWKEYMVLWVLGLRRFIIKDDLKGTDLAKKKEKIFATLTCIILPIYFYLLYKLFTFALFVLGSVLSIFL